MTVEEAYSALLKERLGVIKRTIDLWGEDNFYISYSGGKDSCVVDALVDMALDNNIPRFFADTGIELNLVRKFVYEKAKNDKRIIIAKPETDIKKMLEEDGYPFKSKDHSQKVDVYQTKGMIPAIENYLTKKSTGFYCPDILRYQFTEDFQLKISDKCCTRLKKEPIKRLEKEYNKSIPILGLMREEKGRRIHAQCQVFFRGKLKSFSPLALVTKDWEEWFIKEYDVKIPWVYYSPYYLERTGCKGCPFDKDLATSLMILDKHFPEEKKQCEIIWKPVYDEYRRIGYRL